VLKEIEESNGEIVLFIDELHTLVGAGAAEGAIDASNMLKPALARGELRAIAQPRSTSTANTLRRTPPRAPFPNRLCRRTNVEDTIAILRGLKDRYEAHHNVRIKDSAIVARPRSRIATSATASCRQGHRPGRRSRRLARHSNRFRATEIDQLEREKISLEIEREALKRETDSNSIERRKVVERDAAALTEKITASALAGPKSARPSAASAN